MNPPDRVENQLPVKRSPGFEPEELLQVIFDKVFLVNDYHGVSRPGPVDEVVGGGVVEAIVEAGYKLVKNFAVVLSHCLLCSHY